MLNVREVKLEEESYGLKATIDTTTGTVRLFDFDGEYSFDGFIRAMKDFIKDIEKEIGK